MRIWKVDRIDNSLPSIYIKAYTVYVSESTIIFYDSAEGHTNNYPAAVFPIKHFYIQQVKEIPKGDTSN